MNFPFKLLHSTATAAATTSLAPRPAQGHHRRCCDFLSLSHFLNLVTTKKIVWFGEYHSERRITLLIDEIVSSMHRSITNNSSNNNNNINTISNNNLSSHNNTDDKKKRKLHIVCEHFSFEMQHLIENYQIKKQIDYDGFIKGYKEIGTEGHDLEPYRNLFEYCRHHSDDIRIHAGFIPRPYASELTKLTTVQDKMDFFHKLSSDKLDYLPDVTTLQNIRHRISDVSSDDGINEGQDGDDFVLPGSKSHFNLFESLLSGRDVYNDELPSTTKDKSNSGNRYQKIFQAQLLKDWSMAYRLNALVKDYTTTTTTTTTTVEDEDNSDDKFLILAGKGHLQHYVGVTEIFHWLQMIDDDDHYNNTNMTNLVKRRQQEREKNELLVCAQMMYEVDLDDRKTKDDETALETALVTNDFIKDSMFLSETTDNDDGIEQQQRRRRRRPFEHPIADVLYVYDEVDWNEEEDDDDDDDDDDNNNISSSHDDSIKNETANAYDRVGQTATLKGNLTKARAILTYLGYTPEEQAIIGDDDIYNYQGVGNPFPLAKIKRGEIVLDLGSGLGIDSFLAAHYVGLNNKNDSNNPKKECADEGRVVGIDISSRQVAHANKRAAERGLSSNNIVFIKGDIETATETKLLEETFGLATHENLFDVVISNGAFCLTPDKKKAFETTYRLLKPGGRMVVCTTTVRKDLDDAENTTQWPVCMRMFINIDKLKPLCEDIGFRNVVIDEEDSALEFELEGVGEEEKDFDNGKDSLGREKVHVGSEEFKHLQGYDMNELCARVVVYAEK